MRYIKTDFSNLKSGGQLPQEWSQIGSLSFINKSKLKDIDQRRFQKAFPQQEGGSYHLESILVDWIKGKKHSFILQLSLIEKSSKNKIWELGRTYSLVQDSK